MAPITVLTVVGARPQFIKAAAVSRAIRASDDFSEIMLHTGQHFDEMMSDVFFRELEIGKPEVNLAIHGGTHGAMTGQMLAGIEACLIKRRPDWVLVYGDTNSTLAGALAAAKLHIPVVHVEAGLRSFNRRMPEEVNRVLTDHVSALLLSPTMTGVCNLQAEGITRGVHHVGDVMYDAMLHAQKRSRETSTILADLRLSEGGFALATVHRAENTDDPARLQAVMDAIVDAAGGLPVVLPVHPRTRQAIARHATRLGPIRTIDPVGYIDMVRLLDGAKLVLTDSGGLQKEAYFARRPCVTLRDETEWTETLDHGWNRLWTVPDWKPRSDIADYGTGQAAAAVLDAIRAYRG
ncbi:non-hydrolyzing UDP-N-acetylglucosamine 2-epimerase [Bosea sp. (in: a-proteobacteria)]|uniref:non-hydrolyzing UDP-N-acetylglucosamine 2-epimerase n=1 Tax=Bosea sp. (in: a-proteobacteria) TaxID=1871050 RepID=UPI00262792BA|nr:UDP-N-acetylglucosamine 2-epimerase (non-hydrolyzing) [Bosea sp. (in: a-proteobacteria)]MCO5090675.1 UDP-N-acetylglucosamine 2-epimerase (non-hydrolyzing) [Bosea sp. (in: a-proteobacteria)]